MAITPHTKPVLVIGGTGKTGRRVAERLEARDVPVRIGSRSSEPSFDWEDQSTWAPALQGTSAAYITYFPDLAIPGAPEAVESLSAVALENGVRRLVLLSGRGEEEAQKAEEMLQASGADWTITRASWFNQNFSENYFRDPIMEGEFALPVGEVPEPFVDADDIADVVVAALTEDGHVGQLYELTGPRMLTFEQAIGEITKASGRDIAYLPITMAEYKAVLAEADVHDDIAWLISYLFTEVLDGRNAHLCDGVQRALGREPKDFSEYARDAAASGLWE